MFHTIVAIRDSAAQAYMRPFAVPTPGLAVRSFRDEVNRNAPENQMWFHPADFELFALGEFNDETGSLIPFDAPRSLARAVDMREGPQ